MISLGKTLISDDIADKFFVCDLNKCKGACCEAGDLGAPLSEEELPLLTEAFDKVKKYLPKANLKSIEEQGLYILDSDGDFSTTTVKGKECVYALKEKGAWKCAIEKAYLNGEVKWKKPISCHLYPIRITQYEHYDALNYDRWDICSPACKNGRTLGVPIYVFLKEPLIRKYGETWYKELVKKIEQKV